MVFNIGLTGLDTSQNFLDVTANNIANAASIGFKKSRAEFSDMYSNGIYQKSNLAVGQGSNTSDIGQLFQQGSTQITSSVFDLSIDGTGFFVTSKQEHNQDFTYTRAGAFKLDKENYLTTSSGDYLRSFPVNKEGEPTALSLAVTSAVQIPVSVGSPEATEHIDLSINFPVLTDASDVKDISKFKSDDNTTFNYSTSVIFYDSVGTRHTLKSYYIKPGREMPVMDANKGTEMVDLSVVFAPDTDVDGKTAWAVFYEVDGKPVQPVNKDGNDVQGARYRAKNPTTTDYPKGIVPDIFGTSPALSISVDNTQIGEGCVYPGKIATSTPKSIVPDNAGSGVSASDLSIVSGDKTNKDRPHDFWRCEFIFMGGDDVEVHEPQDPVILQPMGFTGQPIGTTVDAMGDIVPIEPQSITETRLTMDPASFQAPGAGEKGKLSIRINTENEFEDNTGTQIYPYTWDINIDDTVVSLEAFKEQMMNDLEAFKSLRMDDLADLAGGDPITPSFYSGKTVGESLEADGYFIEIDQLSGDIIIQQNQEQQEKNQGVSGTFIDAVMSYKLVDRGTVNVGPPVVNTYTVSKFENNMKPYSTTPPIQYLNGVLDLAFELKIVGSTAPNINVALIQIMPTSTIVTDPESFSNMVVWQFNRKVPPELLVSIDTVTDPITGNITGFKLTSTHPDNTYDFNMHARDLSSWNDGVNPPDQSHTLSTESSPGSPLVELTIVSVDELGNQQTFQVPTGSGTTSDPYVFDHLDMSTILPDTSDFTGTKFEMHMRDNQLTPPVSFLLESGYNGIKSGGIVSPATATKPYDNDNPISATMEDVLSIDSTVELNVNNSEDLGMDILYGAADPEQELTVRYSGNTMYDAPFQVIDIETDGRAVGRLTSVDINSKGLILASFTNGEQQPLGVIALARFNNEQGLLKIGNTSWSESIASGKAIAGEAGSGSLGNIDAASLEQSNVELSNQLVDLIIAQRNYQANARTIEVDSTLQQTILQIG